MDEDNKDSKWLRDLLDIYADGGDWLDMKDILNEVDKLLVEAMLSTDSWSLHDKIKKMIGTK